MDSAFSATDQWPKRGALPTANWRGCTIVREIGSVISSNLALSVIGPIE